MEKSRGFTFIELLVVVCILGVLVTLVGGNYISSLKKARDGTRKADLREIKTALMMYYNNFGSVPETGADNKIAGCGDGTADCEWGSRWEITTTGIVYMKTLPDDPFSPNAQYRYEKVTGSIDDFYLWATLENTSDSDINKTHDRCTDKGVNTYVVCAD